MTDKNIKYKIILFDTYYYVEKRVSVFHYFRKWARLYNCKKNCYAFCSKEEAEEAIRIDKITSPQAKIIGYY